MILTVTLNPAYDKIYWVKELKFDGETILSRAHRTHSSAGGKGINVSIYLGRLGMDNIAMGFIGGHTGRAIKRSLREEGVTTNFNWVDGETRTNVAILRKGKEDQPIEVNEAGTPLTEKDLDRFLDQYKLMLDRVSHAVLSGSLPPNTPDDFYARLVDMAQEADVKTFVNTGPPQLEKVIPSGPFLLKPDIRETNRILGENLDDRESIIRVAQKMLEMGTQYVLISHEITGDILATHDGYWDLEVQRDRLEVKNKVGAGDALVGGIVFKLTGGSPIVQAVKYGMASASASVETYAKMCRDTSLIQAELDKITVQKLEETPQ
ncbi:MAG: 1-phosphofructokinase family hexose kinase [Candidatus Acetothermia bacterium]